MFRRLIRAAAAAATAAAIGLAGPAGAEDPPPFAPVPAAEVTLDQFNFDKRPVVVFADRPNDPAFAKQMTLLQARWPELAARDVVVITDTDPAALTEMRRHFRPRGFQIVLVDKQGQVAMRRPLPTEVREIARAIDRMPDRRNELRPGQFDLN